MNYVEKNFLLILVLSTGFANANVAKDNAWIPPTATAQMSSKSGSNVKGTIDFSENESGIQVYYRLSGLGKSTKHGFHIHEKGDCSSKDAKSAGTHYKKLDEVGGTSLDTPQKFAGDLPEITTDKNGNAEGNFLVSGLSINKNNPIANRAIIVHGGPDDVTRPAAIRVACGVIKEKK